MSVVSKIFIIVNLLLTLLVLAAMGRKIDYSFQGTYKVRYKDNVTELIAARDALETTVSTREEQVAALRKQESKAKKDADEVQGSKDTLQAALNQVAGTIKGLNDQKGDLKRRIATKEEEREKLSREEKQLQEDLKKVKEETQQTILKLKRAIDGWFEMNRRREDLEAQKAGD